MVSELVTAAERLIAAVAHDESRSGGLLSRDTIRKADELRILVLRWQRRQR